jgi:hypothetical protein
MAAFTSAMGGGHADSVRMRDAWAARHKFTDLPNGPEAFALYRERM